MTKRKVTKLFAVVALATSTPAVAGPGHDHPTHEPMQPTTVRAPQTDPWAPPDRAPPPRAPQLGPITVQITVQVLALFGISAPRQLSNGAPACGNVASRAPRRVDCDRKKP